MENKVIAEVKVVPLGTGSTSLSHYVSTCLDPVRASKSVRHQVTPMGTVLEGPLDEVLALVRRMHEAPFTLGAQRVATYINIDDRRDKERRMEDKVRAVS